MLKVITKIDGFLIDNFFQKIVNFTHINPYVLSYYFYGVTFLLSVMGGVVDHDPFIFLFAISCVCNQYFMSVLAKNDESMKLNLFRYSYLQLACRFIVWFLLICSFRIPIFPILYNSTWLFAVYISCCSNPPPKEKVSKTELGFV